MAAQKRRISKVGGSFHGLVNQGSTCYLNSVLQVLFGTQDYREKVHSHSKEHSDSDFIDVQLSDLFQMLTEETATTVEVTNKLGIERVNRQQDSAEYFEKIMLLTSPEAAKVFRGMLVHKTLCKGCRKESKAEGHFWHLPLPLVNSNSEDFSVIEGMEEFFRSSDFSGDNQVFCESCDRKHDAVVVCDMGVFPAVLTLLLKRFEFSYRTMSYTKNNCVVDVPSLLSIPRYQDETYELFAYIEHFGNLKSGHYTATIKCKVGDNQHWLDFNDCSVQRNNQQLQVENDNWTLKSNSAYLLFYRKKTHESRENIKSYNGIGQNVPFNVDNAEDVKPPKKSRVSDENRKVKEGDEDKDMREKVDVKQEDKDRKVAFKEVKVERSHSRETADVGGAKREGKDAKKGMTNQDRPKRGEEKMEENASYRNQEIQRPSPRVREELEVETVIRERKKDYKEKQISLAESEWRKVSAPKKPDRERSYREASPVANNRDQPQVQLQHIKPGPERQTAKTERQVSPDRAVEIELQQDIDSTVTRNHSSSKSKKRWFLCGLKLPKIKIKKAKKGKKKVQED